MSPFLFRQVCIAEMYPYLLQWLSGPVPSAQDKGELVMRAYTPTSSDDDLGHFDLVVKVYFANQHKDYPEVNNLSFLPPLALFTLGRLPDSLTRSVSVMWRHGSACVSKLNVAVAHFVRRLSPEIRASRSLGCPSMQPWVGLES